ncbi:MAG: hypothetical protein FD148_1651 [Methylocystaceae bacterium]|nr:MAG: hypothetical protein FD148_1651 [Methylocystaceae bacterium]
MDARALRLPQRFGAAVDVLLGRARQSRHGGVLDAARHFADALEITGTGDREAGFDNIDAQLVEEIRDLELLFQCHRGAGRLLAVAQGGVENQDARVIICDGAGL